MECINLLALSIPEAYIVVSNTFVMINALCLFCMEFAILSLGVREIIEKFQ